MDALHDGIVSCSDQELLTTAGDCQMPLWEVESEMSGRLHRAPSLALSTCTTPVPGKHSQRGGVNGGYLEVLVREIPGNYCKIFLDKIHPVVASLVHETHEAPAWQLTLGRLRTVACGLGKAKSRT